MVERQVCSAMNTLDQDIRELRTSLGDGSIQRAYRGLISQVSRLRTVFGEERGERAVNRVHQ